MGAWIVETKLLELLSNKKPGRSPVVLMLVVFENVCNDEVDDSEG